MGYVKLPELFSQELVKALAGNSHNVKEEQKHEDEMAAAWKEYIKPEKKCEKKEDDAAWIDYLKAGKKCGKKEDDSAWSDRKHNDDDVCCPQKVKFIFLLDNTVVINVNAIAEEDGQAE